MAMAVAPGTAARADRAAEIARIHVEAMGGIARIRALEALRMTGTVATAAGRLPFVLIAARPDRIRMETRMRDRTVVQGSDGVAPPWELDPALQPPHARPMPPAAAELFVFDSDFDDPLVAWQERGYGLELAGEVELGGRRLLRLLIVRSLTQNVFILLDPQTYLIVLRAQTLTTGGRHREVVSRYGDYRPVRGVLVPHEVAVYFDGELSQQATFDTIEPNPRFSDGIFSPPP